MVAKIIQRFRNSKIQGFQIPKFKDAWNLCDPPRTDAHRSQKPQPTFLETSRHDYRWKSENVGRRNETVQCGTVKTVVIQKSGKLWIYRFLFLLFSII